MSTHKSTDDYGFYHKNAVARGWKVLAVFLVLTLLPDFFVHHDAYFEDQGIHVNASWGFYAWFSLLSCVVFIVLAKVAGIFLKRKAGYYHE